MLASIVNANVWAVLIMSMVVCIILGMGLPVTASYVLAATTLSSVLTGYGLELIPVHMFLLYFATMSAITPPVALASYAAAGIADASPNKVGWQGLVLVLPSFLVPFVFIFNQELLLIGNGLDIILAVLSASAGIFAFSIITEGWIFGKVPTPARVLRACRGLRLWWVCHRPGRLCDLSGRRLNQLHGGAEAQKGACIGFLQKLTVRLYMIYNIFNVMQ